MTRSPLDDFREYADILGPRSLHQFLAIQAWTLHTQKPLMETWIHADDPSRQATAVHIPRVTENVDFERRLAEAAARVARVFDWSLSELAEQVANAHADIFYVRVRSAASDGTIALRQANLTIDAIEKMVKSAAIITNNPNAKGTGRTSERVATFLSDDLRMGHTRRGSFIITVAARLEERRLATSTETVTPEWPIDEAMASQQTPGVDNGVTPPGHVPPGEMDFTRRVMTTLSRSLDLTSRHLGRGDDFIDLEGAQDGGMTIPIVEAVEEIANRGASTTVDLEFEWSPVLRQAADVPQKVTFEAAQIERIPVTIERMRGRSEPTDVVQVIGPVVSLARDEADDAESGEVHVLADVDGALRKVAIDLTGVAYDWAIYAHRHHLPFSAEGVLDKVGNRWKIVDRLALDTRFLQQFQAERIQRLTGEQPESADGPPLD